MIVPKPHDSNPAFWTVFHSLVGNECPDGAKDGCSTNIGLDAVNETCGNCWMDHFEDNGMELKEFREYSRWIVAANKAQRDKKKTDKFAKKIASETQYSDPNIPELAGFWPKKGDMFENI